MIRAGQTAGGILSFGKLFHLLGLKPGLAGLLSHTLRTRGDVESDVGCRM